MKGEGVIKWDRALNHRQVGNQIKDKCRFEMKDWDDYPKYLCVSNSSLHARASAYSGSNSFFFFFNVRKRLLLRMGHLLNYVFEPVFVFQKSYRTLYVYLITD